MNFYRFNLYNYYDKYFCDMHLSAFIGVSARQAAYYPSCWLIVEPEKLKRNTFSPLIRDVPSVKPPSSSLASQNYISLERKDLGWTNHNNEILPPTVCPSNAYQVSAFTKRRENKYNSFNATLKDYARKKSWNLRNFRAPECIVAISAELSASCLQEAKSTHRDKLLLNVIELQWF